MLFRSLQFSEVSPSRVMLQVVKVKKKYYSVLFFEKKKKIVIP